MKNFMLGLVTCLVAVYAYEYYKVERPSMDVPILPMPSYINLDDPIDLEVWLRKRAEIEGKKKDYYVNLKNNKNFDYDESKIEPEVTIKSMKIGEEGFTLPWFFNGDYPVYKTNSGNAKAYIKKIADNEFLVKHDFFMCSARKALDRKCKGIFNINAEFLREE